MHRYVLLPQESLWEKSDCMLPCPLLNDDYTMQLLRSSLQSHSLVIRNDTPLGPDRELNVVNLPEEKFSS